MHESLENPVARPRVALELPFDFYRVPGSARRLQSYRFTLPDHSGESGSNSNRDASVPDAVLTAAFGVLLARYNGQPAISVRLSRSSVRSALPWTRMLDLEIGEATTGRDVLEQTRDLLSPSERAPARTGPGSAQDAAGGRAAIIWQQSEAWWESDGSAEREGDEGQELGALCGGSDADLTLVIGSDSASRAAFVYDSRLFKPSSIERFAGHLRMLLSNLTTNLDKLVFELPLLLPEEQEWLESVCDGRTRAVPSQLVHQLVERQAAAAPEAIALRFRDQSLTYGELNRRANQLAHHLAERGIGAGNRVVVCVEPAFDIVLALLGILKAGAVYVPLDPSYPRARIDTILDDTRPKLIITQNHLRARLEPSSVATLVLDALPHDSYVLLDEDPHTPILPEQTAYVYYTSGTTGHPKGVMGNHSNLLHYVEAARQRYQMGSRDVMPAIARFGFSISMFELLFPLIAGGTLIILEREHILDPARMSRTLGEVTIFHAGPSLLKGLVAYIRGHDRDFQAFSGVRHASSGGDMVPPELLEAMSEIFSNAEVFVIYGCSEISCMGCTYPVPRDRAVTTTYVGRPFDNVVVRVLDGVGNVLPAGIVGEIHFAGHGVTQGYLNRAELTAEKFVSLGGRRFYRTGDRGRLSEDGWLEILGRNDFQTKLRGMRVELGEVEHQLRRAPGVRDAVATAREGADHEKVLVAYVVTDASNGAVAQSDKPTRIGAIRRYMLDHLPDYMVPAVYVELDRLPVNHNLKIDRRTLPAPDDADLRATSGRSVREPQTATERKLSDFWQKLLGVQRIGLDDNFFELGGHSMLAVLLSLEVEQAFGIRLEGMDILREPLEVLAAICDRHLGVSSSGAQGRAPAAIVSEPVEIFHFGDGRSLYGVLRGNGSSTASSAALICGPVGQEHVRTHFVLTRLAKQLAREGVPTLMFDYFGCGDSLGEGRAADWERWQTNIAEAHAELQRRTKGARVTAVGVRLGGSLLCQAASRLDVARLVLWDPVCEGAEHGAELARMHRAYLRSIAQLRFWKWRRARPRGHELLGTIFSDAAFRELNAFALAPLLAQQRVPIRWLATSTIARDEALFRRVGASDGCRVECLDYECGWRDIARLEDVLPDVHISSTLAKMVMEG